MGGGLLLSENKAQSLKLKFKLSWVEAELGNRRGLYSVQLQRSDMAFDPWLYSRHTSLGMFCQDWLGLIDALNICGSQKEMQNAVFEVNLNQNIGL